MGDVERDKKRKKISSSPILPTGTNQDGGSPLARGLLSEADSDDSDVTVFDRTSESPASISKEKLDRLSSDQKLDIILKKIYDMDTKLKKLEINEQKLHTIETQVEDLTENCVDLQRNYDELKKTVDDHSNRLRRNNVIFYGVPEKAEGLNNGGCIQLVKSIMVDHMKLDAEHWEIERAHRTPTGPPQGERTRPIHVKFLRYQNRVDLLRQAPIKLKDNEYEYRNVKSRIYVADDVTISVREDRKKLVVLKKQLKTKFPKRKVFIPPSVPAVLLRENSAGKLVRVALGTPLNTLD
jgi:hypothetical protein